MSLFSSWINWTTWSIKPVLYQTWIAFVSSMPSHATSLTMNGVTCMHAQWLKDPVLATFLSLYNEISLNIAYMIWFGFVAWPIKRKCGSGSLVAGMLIDILYHMVLPGNATSDALERTINLVLGGCFWHHKDLSEKNKSCCNRAGCNQWTSRIVGWKKLQHLYLIFWKLYSESISLIWPRSLVNTRSYDQSKQFLIINHHAPLYDI